MFHRPRRFRVQIQGRTSYARLAVNKAGLGPEVGPSASCTGDRGWVSQPMESAQISANWWVAGRKRRWPSLQPRNDQLEQRITALPQVKSAHGTGEPGS